jgi:hypothetical protein
MLDDELGHYYNTYGHIDTLKLGILMQIKLMKLDSSEITLREGSIELNGISVASANNIPMISGNKSLSTQMEKKRELDSRVAAFRKSYLSDPSDENENSFFNAK